MFAEDSVCDFVYVPRRPGDGVVFSLLGRGQIRFPGLGRAGLPVAQITSDEAEFFKALKFLIPKANLEYIIEFFNIRMASRGTAAHLACFVFRIFIFHCRFIWQCTVNLVNLHQVYE